MTLDEILAKCVAAIENEDSPLIRWFDHGRIQIVGPWKFHDGKEIKWQGIISPYNAYMSASRFDRDVEGVGATPVAALMEALKKFRALELEAENERSK